MKRWSFLLRPQWLALFVVVIAFVAGIAYGKPVFSLPGSRAAVVLGMEELILPELGHLINELRK